MPWGGDTASRGEAIAARAATRTAMEDVNNYKESEETAALVALSHRIIARLRRMKQDAAAMVAAAVKDAEARAAADAATASAEASASLAKMAAELVTVKRELEEVKAKAEVAVKIAEAKVAEAAAVTSAVTSAIEPTAAASSAATMRASKVAKRARALSVSMGSVRNGAKRTMRIPARLLD